MALVKLILWLHAGYFLTSFYPASCQLCQHFKCMVQIRIPHLLHRYFQLFLVHIDHYFFTFYDTHLFWNFIYFTFKLFGGPFVLLYILASQMACSKAFRTCLALRVLCLWRLREDELLWNNDTQGNHENIGTWQVILV